MKSAAHAVDIDEGARAGVRAVGEKDKCTLMSGVYPAACARKACVAEAIGRERRPGGRAVGGGQFPGDRTRLFHAFGHVRAKERTRFGPEQSSAAGNKLFGQPCGLRRGGKGPGVPRRTTQEMRISIMHLAPDKLLAPVGLIAHLPLAAHLPLVSVAQLARRELR